MHQQAAIGSGQAQIALQVAGLDQVRPEIERRLRNGDGTNRTERLSKQPGYVEDE
jgi:hypothetical protein